MTSWDGLSSAAQAKPVANSPAAMTAPIRDSDDGHCRQNLVVDLGVRMADSQDSLRVIRMIARSTLIVLPALVHCALIARFTCLPLRHRDDETRISRFMRSAISWRPASHPGPAKVGGATTCADMANRGEPLTGAGVVSESMDSILIPRSER